MRHLIPALILVIVTTLSWAGAPQAQGLGTFLPEAATRAAGTEAQTDTGAAPQSSAPRRTSEQAGIQVIVVDTEGNVVATGDTAATSDAARSAGIAAAATGADSDFDGPQEAPLMRVQRQVDEFRSALIDRITTFPGAIEAVSYILRAASPDGTIFAFVKTLGLSLLVLGVGTLIVHEVFAKRLVRRFVMARILDAPRGYTEKIPFLVFRFAMHVLAIVLSMVVAYLIGFAIFGRIEDTAVQFTVSLINIGYFACRFIAGLWRMILSPFLPQYRIPALTDPEARKLHRWMWMMGSFDVCAITFGLWIGELGLTYDIYALVASALSLIIVVANMVLVVANYRAVNSALRDGKPLSKTNLVTRFLCRVWAPVIFVYVVFAWFELTYDLVLGNPSSIPLIAGAYGILVSIIVVYGLINYLIERGFARARAIRMLKAQRLEREMLEQAESDAKARALRTRREDGPDEDDPAPALAEQEEIIQGPVPTRAEIDAAQKKILAGHPEPADLHGRQLPSLNSFEALARRVAGVLAFVAGAYAFFYIWDNEGAALIESYADHILHILVIVFLGYIAYHAFRIWIDNKIADEMPDTSEVELGDEGGGSSASRLATLLPLFRNAILIVIVVTITLILLMEIGVNVGPLFAGAGIVGVAIGFGSQALVRDIFAGAFFLFDDAFRKGEYLDVGGVKGTVEKISVRSFQLRHHLGYLHTIPFGELQVMTNFSRDWVMMKLPLRVTYDTDVEQVRKLIKKLGLALLEDPVIGENFIQPLKSQGVIEMQDSAMIIRVKFMTKPGDQWLVRKRVYEEIRSLFEREGIKFAHREVTVRLADGRVSDLTDEQRRAVSAAAQASNEQELAEESDTAGDKGGDDR